MFTGFPQETIRFFLDLRFHNETTWFHAHRDEYEQYVREPFKAFIDELAPTMLQISDDLEVRPHKCLARINRDIRYTRDKSPYRDHLWLLFRRSAEEKDKCVHYWFELSPGGVTWGLGFWGMNKEAMDQLRLMMLKQPQKVRKAFRVLDNSPFIVSGNAYSKLKLPEELAPDLAPMYRMKQIYFERTGTSLADAYSPALAETVAKDFLLLKPLYQLMREAADKAIARPIE